MNVYLVAVRYHDGDKALFRADDMASFDEAHWHAQHSGFRVALTLVQPIATGVKETA
jgi:hypothetical protein